MVALPRSAAAAAAAAAAVYLLDRATKAWAESMLAVRGSVEILPGVLHLTYTRNSGGAFGLGNSAPWFFATASLVISAIIVVAALRPHPTGTALAMGMILGGALGNLTDRALHGPWFSGGVTDFVDLRVWPIFNLADSAIVIGATLLVLAVGRESRPTEREPDRG